MVDQELRLNCSPDEVGLHAERWQCVLDQAQLWCEADEVPAISLIVGKQGAATAVHQFGRQQIEANEPVRDDAIFLVASITKPIVAMAALQLLEQGLLTLNDKVRHYIPEFKGSGKNSVTIRHLLTHTSGLPDMLPNDFELRNAHTSLAGFVSEICKTELLYHPGQSVAYQSMGFALLGEIVARVSEMSCADYLQQHIFTPLKMQDTTLGAPESWYAGEQPKVNRIVEIRLPEAQLSANWNWNEKYWQSLGAPWGGLLTTATDLARFAQMMLNGGSLDGVSILSSSTIAAATRNQLAFLPEVPEEARRCRPWGLGWKRNWPGYSAHFGDLLSPATYGHWGATGTLLWLDPGPKSFGILLSTQPQEPHGRYSAKLTNMIQAALQ